MIFLTTGSFSWVCQFLNFENRTIIKGVTAILVKQGQNRRSTSALPILMAKQLIVPIQSSGTESLVNVYGTQPLLNKGASNNTYIYVFSKSKQCSDFLRPTHPKIQTHPGIKCVILKTSIAFINDVFMMSCPTLTVQLGYLKWYYGKKLRLYVISRCTYIFIL